MKNKPQKQKPAAKQRYRGLVTKMVLLMLLMILILMAITSVLLVRGVRQYYTSDFYRSMQEAFSDEEMAASIYGAVDRPDGAERLYEVLSAYSGALGINAKTRNFYVLDMETGEVLTGSDTDTGIEITPNILSAMAGESGDSYDISDGPMDLALPVQGSGGGFIICIRDSRQTARNVTRELVNIILQAVAVGAVISAALSIVFAQALLRPVRDMTKAAGSMAGGDFSAKIGVDASDEVGGLAVAFNDMAQQLESTLSELKEEESRRREFVANVSHELRTPLTSIISYSETLVENLDMPDDMREEFLNVIMNESDRMATIVQNLLELSRFDSGRWQMNFEPFSLERSVREVYSAVALEAKKHSHRIDLAFERRLPDVLGDKSRIEEVLMNVITNAIKYTPDGGEINVSTGRSGDRIWIRVRDTGIGIPEADLPRVFERFYRVDKARSRASGGTGLGLAIAKEIVERHGGEILMKSAEGVGTTVTIYLPAALEDGEQARA